jgi:hypothetical protein
MADGVDFSTMYQAKWTERADKTMRAYPEGFVIKIHDLGGWSFLHAEAEAVIAHHKIIHGEDGEYMIVAKKVVPPERKTRKWVIYWHVCCNNPGAMGAGQYEGRRGPLPFNSAKEAEECARKAKGNSDDYYTIGTWLFTDAQLSKSVS